MTLSNIDTNDNNRSILKKYENQRLSFYGVVISIESKQDYSRKTKKEQSVTFASIYIPQLKTELDHLVISMTEGVINATHLQRFKTYNFTGKVNHYMHHETRKINGDQLHLMANAYGVQDIDKIKRVESNLVSKNRLTKYLTNRVDQLYKFEGYDREELIIKLKKLPNNGSREEFIDHKIRTIKKPSVRQQFKISIEEEK